MEEQDNELRDDLGAALRWLVDDLGDAGEDRNQESGEEYDSVRHARNVLDRWAEKMKDEEEKRARELEAEEEVRRDLELAERLRRMPDLPWPL